MGYAKPTTARLIDQRARRRATQDLIEAHREEWDVLFDTHRASATVEADELAAKASETHPSVDDPPRLMPGRRAPGQTPLDRIDVARCPHCVKHHDRRHVCPKCGALPQLTLPEQIAAVGQLHADGVPSATISTTLRIPLDHVHRFVREQAQETK